MKDLTLALEIISALFKHAPELVDLIDRWFAGEEGSDDDPIYREVKARLDSALLRLDNEIDKLDDA